MNDDSPAARRRAGWQRGVLGASLRSPSGQTPGPGLHRLDDAELLVPATLPGRPAPLVVLLHGAGSRPASVMPTLSRQAERRGFLVLAPKSRGSTWDAVHGGFGPDVERVDRALADAADRVGVDPVRVSIAGFSDGATYALTLGLVNGRFFRSIVAFSPGFVATAQRDGRPPVLVSHGRGDTVLPIDRCSRRIVPMLRAQGYAVDYREFDGGHVVPFDAADAGAALIARP